MATTKVTEDVRGRVGAMALLAAPAVLLAAAVLHPREVTDPGRQLDIVAGALSRWYVAHLLYIIGFALMVPAVLTLGRRLRQLAPRLELWGTGVAIAGLFASAALVAVEGFGGWILARASDRAAATETFDRILHSGGIMPFGVAGIAVPLGLIVLAVGLRRADQVSPWVAWTMAAGALLLAVGLGSLVKPVLVIGLAALSVAMGSVGVAAFGGGRLAIPSAANPHPAASRA